MKQTNDVFGINNEISEYSYVDRGELDSEITLYLRRSNHIALRGESKCGKSWLRQKCIPDAIVVQCRLHTSVLDIYTDVLSQLGIKLIVEHATKDTIKGKIESTGSIGFELITKLKIKLGIESIEEESKKGSVVGHDINDLKFIADLIKESKRRVAIEDFHYLSISERKKFAFDLKALWDYGCFFVIIGVWSRSNLLIFLNPDLGGRIIEIPVYWTTDDLNRVIDQGSTALKISISDEVKKLIVADSYSNAGILQQLILMYLDEEKVFEENIEIMNIDSKDCFDSAAMKLADQLNTKYMKFAKDVSTGIRNRKDSTGIYAHSMAVIMSASDQELIDGLHLDSIYSLSHRRQPRIQRGNQRTVLQKLEELQVDDEERGLVLAYNDATDEVTAIDRTMLFYRKYVTVNWPWEDLIKESEEIGC